MSHGKTDPGSGASDNYRPETAPQLMFYTPQEDADTCRHNHIGNELIRTVFCSDLRQEEGWKYWNMLITKLNIMFSAWQHNDGHPDMCMNMYVLVLIG